MIVDFNDRESASIKSFAVKKKGSNKSSHQIYVWQIANVCETVLEKFYIFSL